jgi:RHS repeat-associated protein
MRFSSKPWIAHNGSATDGLCYYGYRFYDLFLQRWLNRDPLGESSGLNLYRFVGNNPISTLDPDGRDVVYLLDPAVLRGADHAAILIGNDQDGWHYFSFGMGQCWFIPGPAWRDNLEYIGFNSFAAARQDIRLARYQSYARWHTDSSADKNAIAEMRKWFNRGYVVCGRNCDDAAAAGIRAAGVDFHDKWRPKKSYETNRSHADESGDFPQKPVQPFP